MGCTMDANFLERIQRMQLTTEEDETITICLVRRQEILDEYSLSLIGKFLTTKLINLRAAKNLLGGRLEDCGGRGRITTI